MEDSTDDKAVLSAFLVIPVSSDDIRDAKDETEDEDALAESAASIFTLSSLKSNRENWSPPSHWDKE